MCLQMAEGGEEEGGGGEEGGGVGMEGGCRSVQSWMQGRNTGQ